MKYVYYGFGGFIGLVCGVIIALIFVKVEESGYPILSDLGNNYGIIGRHVGNMVNALPFLGAGLGILMVKIMFKKELEDNRD